MPNGAVYVGRPTIWGNPFVPMFNSLEYRRLEVERYRVWLSMDPSFRPFISRPSPDMVQGLRGKDLACWCPLDQPCHADVLLELANAPALSAGSESKDQEQKIKI